LYKEFKRDERWDSPHNKKLIDRIPSVYRSPKIRDPRPGLTTYLAPVGKELAFTGTREGLRLQDFTDGTSNTAVLVDVTDKAGVIWSKPEDLIITNKDPKSSLFGHYPGFTLVGLGDGTVRRVPRTTPANMLWALFTRAGGEVLNLPE
jgi:hypothetical protein